jgi:hypothetical protein
VILSIDHIRAATKPERDIIANWLRDSGVDVDRLLTFDLAGTCLTVVYPPGPGEPPEVTGVVTVTFPVTDAPLATIHELWDRVGPVETAADDRQRDALVDFRDRYS